MKFLYSILSLTDKPRKKGCLHEKIIFSFVQSIKYSIENLSNKRFQDVMLKCTF